MSEVPKFVRQKLAQQAAGEHPDANVLAGFTEGGLSKTERAQVVAHLSACVACRETVALALPEIPGVVPATAPAVSLWTRWPMLRWAGVGAAVLVVAAAVTVKDMRETASTAQFAHESAATPARPTQPEAALEQPTAAPGVPVQKQKQAEVTAPTHARGTRRSLDSEAHRQPMLPGTGTSASAGDTAFRMTPLPAKAGNAPAKKKDEAAGVAGTSLHGIVGGQRDDLAPLPVPAAPAAATATSIRPQSNAEAGAAAPGAARAAITDEAKQRQALAPAPAANAVRGDEFGLAEAVATQQQAKTARNPVAINGAVGGPVPGPPMAKVVYSTGTPRWRISAEGTVERSLDAGQSWQRIAVADRREMFRSVAVVENEVWAGGAEGALYHSGDNGRTWKRVPVKAGDEVLEADIARVEFTDARHGFVTTTAGETWSTGDGGATWSAVRR